MSPKNHFAEYAKRDPKGYQTFSDNMWNSFVAITHKIGLSPFFSFTPDFLQDLNAEAIGKQLGTVYNLSKEDQQAPGRFIDGEIPG
jgi:hypothetical protein